MTRRLRSFDGRVVVITGAASGIGRALAVELAGRGAHLALSDIDEVDLAATAASARDQGARSVRADRIDVADRTAMASYAATVAEHFGRVNVVFNNAGVSVSGDLTELSYDDLDWIIGINFWGVVHGTKEFLPHLIASGEGHLVNISSLFGLMSVPGQSAYNASKYAVRGLSEAVREEMLVAGRSVGVSVVHPGGIKTGIARNGRVTGGLGKQRSAQVFDEQLARTTPERAAEVIVAGVLAGKPRILVGADAHAIHQFARLTGPRYQDVVARLTRWRLAALEQQSDRAERAQTPR